MSKKYLIIIFCMLSFIGISQTKTNKQKPFVSFCSSNAFLKNKTKYFGVSFGIKVKCKYKFGFNYSWLRGNYKTDNYPVNLVMFPNSENTTKTDAKFYSALFEPIILTVEDFSISLPLNIGYTNITSAYKTNLLLFTEYYNDYSLFGAAKINFDYNIFRFVKIGFYLGYQYVNTELKIGKEAFNTPTFGFKIKLGKACN